jgi:hypothetical protein
MRRWFLSYYPNRLLVTVTPAGGEPYVEVAHEAIFRRWNKVRDWIAVEREFLAWRNGLEAARRAWQTEEMKEYAWPRIPRLCYSNSGSCCVS